MRGEKGELPSRLPGAWLSQLTSLRGTVEAEVKAENQVLQLMSPLQIPTSTTSWLGNCDLGTPHPWICFSMRMMETPLHIFLGRARQLTGSVNIGKTKCATGSAVQIRGDGASQRTAGPLAPLQPDAYAMHGSQALPTHSPASTVAGTRGSRWFVPAGHTRFSS